MSALCRGADRSACVAQAGAIPSGAGGSDVLTHGGQAGDWRFEQGELVLAAPQARRGWLLTEKDYKDFRLRLEFQHTGNAVSGVTFYRLPQDPWFEKVCIGGIPENSHGALLAHKGAWIKIKPKL